MRTHCVFILSAIFLSVVWTQGPRISLEAETYFVNEEDGSITVCAVVNGGSLSSSVVVTITTLSSTATSPDDFVNVEQQHTFTPGGITRQCSDIQINSDEIVEGSESFSAGLQSTTDILESPTSAFIIILDNSMLTLQLDQTEYNVLEGIILRVCVVVASGETERPVSFQITSGGGSASALSDYLESEHTGSFPSGSVPGDERCVSVNTFFDRAVENTETFLVQLDSFDAVIVTDGTAIANIQDNDGVDVSWQEAAVTIPEGNNGDLMQANLCITLDDRAGGLQREARFILTTVMGTADNSDYVPLSEVTIAFPALISVMEGDVICQSVTVIGDDIMEGNETFTVVMTPENDLDDIIGSSSVTITILTDADDMIACPELMNPENGQVDNNGMTENSIATYSCDNGYTLNGPLTRTCSSDGVWSESEPSCQIVDCNDPPSPSNASPASMEISTTFGATVTYVCDNGFQAVGDATIMCEASGSWSGQGPDCQAVDCGPLESPMNGAVAVPLTEFPGTATYTCDTGYVLSGGNTRTCLANGMWSGIAPTCTVVTCPVLISPLNANVQHPSGVDYLSTAIYSCNPGHERASGDLQRVCGEDGTWSGTEPVCLAVDCGSLDPPLNGDVVLTGTTFNEEADYSCDNGYSFSQSGNANRQCMSNGEWSGSSPSCMIVDCGVLVDPSNGQVDFPATTYGSVAQYTCTAGCVPVGNTSRTCTADGTWSGSIPQCPVIQCGGLANPMNGIVEISSSRAGGVVTYTCNAGYEVAGEAERMCLCTGQWSGTPASCQAVDCGNIEPPANGMVTTAPDTVYLSTATYECDEGYQLSDTSSMTRTCEASGEWSGTEPQCEIVMCGSLNDINNGEVDITGSVYNSTATYSCVEGYQLDGDMQRTCLSTGAWSGSEPECSFVLCEILTPPANGVVMYTATIVFNSLAVFDCDDGFNLIGTDRRTCLATGEWSGQSPQCIEIVCGPLSSPENGNVMVSGTGLGAEAMYTCNTGYSINGESTRDCENSSSPQWSGNAPVCNIVSCGSLPSPTNGIVQFLPSVTYQSIAEYSCTVGYRLSGPSSLTCEANGQWSDSPPLCEVVVCPELSVPQNGNIEYDNTPSEYNSEAVYSCTNGFTVDGDAMRVCQSDGTWSGNSAICQPADCGNLTNPMNGIVQYASTTFTTGLAIYECNEDYTLNGNPSRICQADGSWSGQSPVCDLVDCGNPPLVLSASFPSSSDTTVGNSITYTCFEGHRLVGDAQTTCQSNGQWSGTRTCADIECVDLNNPLNGEVTVSGLTFGNTAMYTCNGGFVLVGNDMRECVGEGTWSGSAPSCRTVTCPALMAPANGQVSHESLEYNSLATYTCNEGHTLRGAASRVCSLDGSWSGQEPSCDPVDCGSLSDPPNGMVNASTTVLGSQATYTCQGSGYVLTGDSSRQCGTNGMWTGSQPVCDNIDECQNSNGMCEHTCVDTSGAYFCTCRMGYTENEENQFLCRDVNECEAENGGCAHSCVNYEGGFNCSCDAGYMLSNNEVDCIDIDECELGQYNCHPNATCSNVDGGFECICNIGFEGDGITCINTDECVQSGNPCHENAVCTDTDGSFVCKCQAGFEGDGNTVCQNVDECADSSLNNCHPRATCTDTDGSFMCTCNDGYAGNGVTCEVQCLTNFQLVLGPVDSCLNWRFDSTAAKLTDITVATVSYLNTICDCSLPRSHVYANEFTCAYNDAQEVIYRAKLQGVEATDCDNLTSYVQEWIDAESSILIQGNRLQLDSSCDLEIESLDIQAACVIGMTPTTPTTETPTPESGGLSIEIIIGAAAAGALIIILLLLLILVICCMCCRHSRDKKGDQDEYSTLSRPFGSGRSSIGTTHSYTGQVPPRGTRTVYDYNSDIDIKSSTTFEPGRMSRTPSIPLVHMTDVRRVSGHSSRSGSFTSIDPNELAYANMTDIKEGEEKKFDDPVYEYIKGEEEEIARNPLYDSTRKKSGCVADIV